MFAIEKSQVQMVASNSVFLDTHACTHTVKHTAFQKRIDCVCLVMFSGWLVYMEGSCVCVCVYLCQFRLVGEHGQTV